MMENEGLGLVCHGETAEDPEECYVLLPVLGESGYYAVFRDGSYTRWNPGGAGPSWDRSRV